MTKISAGPGPVRFIPSHAKDDNVLPVLQGKHLELTLVLEDLLIKNPKIIASDRGKLALFQAVDQNAEFKKIVLNFLKSPIPGEPTTKKSATGSWAVQEAMEALPASSNFNRSELGFMIGSIAMDQETSKRVDQSLLDRFLS